MRVKFSLWIGLALVGACCAKSEKQKDVSTIPSTSVPGREAGTTTGLNPIAIPTDGKIENVRVEGVTVPMIQIMEDGQIVLVDIDGVKPRTWEEQYKRKGALPKGYFDLHRTDSNKNNRFDDDPVDKQGRWKMDEKGNLARD